MRKLLRRLRKGTSHVHNVKVWIAVIVIVAPSSAGPHVLWQLGRPVAMKVLKMDSCPFRHIFELHSRVFFGYIFRQARNASVVDGVKVAVNPFADTMIVPAIGWPPDGLTVKVVFVTINRTICLLNCS